MWIKYVNTFQYFCNKPCNSNSIIIDRVIISRAPDFESVYGKEKIQGILCKPYLQLFIGSTIVYDSSDSNLITITRADESFAYKIEAEVQGDVLIRLKYYHSPSKRDSICRIYFNTDFIENCYLRAEKVRF